MGENKAAGGGQVFLAFTHPSSSGYKGEAGKRSSVGAHGHGIRSACITAGWFHAKSTQRLGICLRTRHPSFPSHLDSGGEGWRERQRGMFSVEHEPRPPMLSSAVRSLSRAEMRLQLSAQHHQPSNIQVVLFPPLTRFRACTKQGVLTFARSE